MCEFSLLLSSPRVTSRVVYVTVNNITAIVHVDLHHGSHYTFANVHERMSSSSSSSSSSHNPKANVFILVNLGCEMLFVIDQRLKAQQITVDKSIQVIHDVTTVLLEPKFIDSLLIGSMHSKAQLLTAEHCKFMLNDIATCSLMRLDDNSMDKLWNLMTMVYKWQLFVSRHQHHLLDITFRHLDAINRLYPDAKRHMLIDFTKNTLLDFWNSNSEDEQLAIYQTNNSWLQCFNTKISLLIRLGFQSLDGDFFPHVERSYFPDFIQTIGDNIYVKSALALAPHPLNTNELPSSRMDQLAAQLELKPIDVQEFQQQYEQSLQQCNILFDDPQYDVDAACEFVQLPKEEKGGENVTAAAGGSASGGILNQQLLDLYSKMH